MSSASSDAVLEEILLSVGDNGKYQTRLMWIFFIPINLIIPWTALVQIFQSSVPEHWCYVPGKPDDLSMDEWKNITIPWVEEDGESILSKCQQFVSARPGDPLRVQNSSRNTIACQNGWAFDTIWYDRTLPMDLEWVCDRSSLNTRWLSAGFAGQLVGTLLFSILADMSGRKLVAVLAAIMYPAFAIGRVFVTSEWGLLVLMFISAMPFPAILDVSWIWVTEQVAPDTRAKMITVNFIAWSFGMCSLPLLAWLTRDWIWLGIITSVPFIPFLAIWWLFPESPRWLLEVGRVKDSAEAFKTIAKINGNTCPQNIEEMLQNLSRNEKRLGPFSSLNFMEILKFPVIRKRLLLLTWFLTCNALIYYGVLLNNSNISGNEFLNFFLLAVCEVPGNFVGWFFAQTFGRRISAFVFCFLAALAAAVAAFVTNLGSWIEIFTLILCKTFINICFLMNYLQLVEVLPTSHRSSGFGLASIVSALLGISTPYIAHSGSRWPPLPYVIFSLFGATAAVTALFVPETLGVKLPQNIPEAEVMLVDQPFWSYLGWRPTNRRARRKEGTRDDGVDNLAMSRSSLDA